MSLETFSERVCYVQCNFCNTILAVSVPVSSMFTIATVRCGHCANLLSVNMGASLHQSHVHMIQDFQLHQKQHFMNETAIKDNGSSSKWNKIGSLPADQYEQPKMPPIRLLFRRSADVTPENTDVSGVTSAIGPKEPKIKTPEKRQRVPSAYNRFIKEEIQRIKASNPEISHREAFSTAAKNWAHFPHIHFGLKLESNKQAKLDHAGDIQGTQKSLGLY